MLKNKWISCSMSHRMNKNSKVSLKMPRKKRALRRDQDFEAQVVAWLRSHSKSEKAIGSILGVSQPEVARLKRRAEERGWLQIRCVIPPERMREIERRFFHHEHVVKNLRRLARTEGVHHVRDVHIFESGGEGTDAQHYNE